jgi:hypothetical protein
MASRRCPQVCLSALSRSVQVSWPSWRGASHALDYPPDPAWMSAFVTRVQRYACPSTDCAALADVLQGLAGVDSLPDAEFWRGVSATSRVAAQQASIPARTSLKRSGLRPSCTDAMAQRATRSPGVRAVTARRADRLISSLWRAPPDRSGFRQGSRDEATASQPTQQQQQQQQQQRCPVLLAAVESVAIGANWLASLGWMWLC